MEIKPSTMLGSFGAVVVIAGVIGTWYVNNYRLDEQGKDYERLRESVELIGERLNAQSSIIIELNDLDGRLDIIAQAFKTHIGIDAHPGQAKATTALRTAQAGILAHLEHLNAGQEAIKDELRLLRREITKPGAK